MTLSSNSTLFPTWSDHVLQFFFKGMAFCAALLVCLVLLFLASEAVPFLCHEGLGSFFYSSSWYPFEQLYNVLPLIWGTLLTSTGALLLAAPLGICSALFCNFYAPAPLAFWYRKVIALLAGVPSVVYGLWGLVVLVPLINGVQPPGASVLAGILILAFMIVPTVALLVDASFKQLPSEYLLGSAALGLSRWTTVSKVVIPQARSGIFAGLLLAMTRALGETMAVLMVCGNVVQVPASFFDPVRTLTANIALEMAYAMGDHRAALFVSGFLLAFVVLVLLVIAEILRVRNQYAS